MCIAQIDDSMEGKWTMETNFFGVETPLSIDEATKNRLLVHFARVLVDMDLFKRIFMKFWLGIRATLFMMRCNMRNYINIAIIVRWLDMPSKAAKIFDPQFMNIRNMKTRGRSQRLRLDLVQKFKV